MAKTNFTNDELASIFDYLQGHISQAQLCREIARARTNTYYYVGQALAYWLKIGVIQFTDIKDAKQLGGKEFNTDVWV